MKKSEAMKKLSYLLKQMSNYECGDADDVEWLLDFLENTIGMMPPPLNHDDYRWEEE